jgi:hypothetical protein
MGPSATLTQPVPISTPKCVLAVLHYKTIPSNILFQVDFGGASAIRSVDPSLPKELDYFGSSVNALISAGLVLNSTVLGAPYDWRLEPSGSMPSRIHFHYFQPLSSFIVSLIFPLPRFNFLFFRSSISY